MWDTREMQWKRTSLCVSTGVHPFMSPITPPFSGFMYFIYSLLSFYGACLEPERKSHFFKISMQTWFTLRYHASFGRRRGRRDGGGDNQLIWSSALGNGERKRSWGTDIHLLGMIELRTEWELQRRENWRNEVVRVTEDEDACAWEMQGDVCLIRVKDRETVKNSKSKRVG